MRISVEIVDDALLQLYAQPLGGDNRGSSGRGLSSNGLTYFEGLKFRML
jgi:hypothetical protein